MWTICCFDAAKDIAMWNGTSCCRCLAPFFVFRISQGLFVAQSVAGKAEVSVLHNFHLSWLESGGRLSASDLVPSRVDAGCSAAGIVQHSSGGR